MKNKNSDSTFKVHILFFFTDCCKNFIPTLEANVPSLLRTGQLLCVVHYRNNGSCSLLANALSYRQHKYTILYPSWSDLSQYSR